MPDKQTTGGKPTESARYQPGRDTNGHFLPGNSISLSARGTDQKRLTEAKRNFSALVTDEQRAALWDSLYDLCMNCEVPDVRHKAIIYALDRLYGKPRERVDVEVEGMNQNVNVASFNLDPAQIEVAQKLLKQIAMSNEPKPLEG